MTLPSPEIASYEGGYSRLIKSADFQIVVLVENDFIVLMIGVGEVVSLYHLEQVKFVVDPEWATDLGGKMVLLLGLGLKLQ